MDCSLTQSMLHLGLFDAVPVDQLIPAHAAELLLRVAQVELAAESSRKENG